MKEKIKLNSRYGKNNYLQRAKGNSYFLKTPYSYRCGYTHTNKKFVDPSGGPMIVEGSYLEEAKAVVKSIDAVDGGTLITFEDDICSNSTDTT